VRGALTSPAHLSPIMLRDAIDEELAKALLAREPGAPLVAWHRFRPLVIRILQRGLSSKDAVEDAAQEVFAALFVSIHTLRDPRALRGFIIALAIRAIGQELRRRRRGGVPVDFQQLDIVGEQADPFSRHAFWRFCRLVTSLRERERRVLLMCLVEQQRVDEAAEILDLSPPTIRRSLARVRRRLAMWSETDPFLSDFASRRGASMPLGFSTVA
jgi:RNA polymerase sigma-70 factor, ECF subfamily